MTDVDLRPVATPGPPRPHRRRWRWALTALLVVAAVVAVIGWRITRPPAPVSVPDVVDSYRSAPPGSSALLPAGLATGVYVYATSGTERVSAGNVVHHYPGRTTLAVTQRGCGVSARWDALDGRWSRWQICPTAAGWRLVSYVDTHTFLYLTDVHSYTCSGFPTVVCRTETGVLTSIVRPLGREDREVAGTTVQTVHLRIEQHATGASLSEGSVDVWVLPSGLPAALEIHDRGSQEVLGARVTYTEAAEFTLTSTVPLR